MGRPFRRNYFINMPFQKSVAVRFVAISFAVNAIIYFTNLYIYFRFNEYGQSLPLDQQDTFYHYFQIQIELLNSTYLIAAITISFGLIFYGVFFSHRIAGPLHNLKNKFREISEVQDIDQITEINPAGFRTRDYFHELAEGYNHALANIQSLNQHSGAKKQAHPSESVTTSGADLELIQGQGQNSKAA